MIESPEAVELVGYASYDFAFIDGEHGAFGMDMLVNIICVADASSTCPVVLVPSLDRADRHARCRGARDRRARHPHRRAGSRGLCRHALPRVCRQR